MTEIKAYLKMKEVSSAKLVLIRKFNSAEWIVNTKQED
jgi:hypothetical protein